MYDKTSYNLLPCNKVSYNYLCNILQLVTLENKYEMVLENWKI